MLLAHTHDSPARKFSTLRGSSTVGQVFWVARKPAGLFHALLSKCAWKAAGYAAPRDEADYGEWASYGHGCLYLDVS